MKEILFRGKRDYNNEWVYGNLVIDKYNNPHIVPNEYFVEDGHHLQYEDETDKPVFFKSETIGQFTGLYDKNNVRIFEGDIVINTSENSLSIKPHVIEFNPISGYIYANPERKPLIVGNIYDNPELVNIEK